MKSEKLLNDFSEFCYYHPELRFWQALAAWSGHTICARLSWVGGDDREESTEYLDTYYWREKSGKNLIAVEIEDIIKKII